MIKIIVAIIIIVLIAVFLFVLLKKKKFYKGGDIEFLNDEEFRHSYSIYFNDALNYFKKLLKTDVIKDGIIVEYDNTVENFGEQLKKKMAFDCIKFENDPERFDSYDRFLIDDRNYKEFSIKFLKDNNDGTFSPFNPIQQDDHLKEIYLIHSIYKNNNYAEHPENLLGPIAGINIGLLDDKCYNGKGLYLGSIETSVDEMFNSYGCIIGCKLKYDDYVFALPFKENTKEFYEFMKDVTCDYDPQFIIRPHRKALDIFKKIYSKVNGIIGKLIRNLLEEYGVEKLEFDLKINKFIKNNFKDLYYLSNKTYYNIFKDNNGLIQTTQMPSTFKPNEDTIIEKYQAIFIKDNIIDFNVNGVLDNIPQTVEFLQKFIDFDDSLLNCDFENSKYDNYSDYFINKNVMYMIIEQTYNFLIGNEFNSAIFVEYYSYTKDNKYYVNDEHNIYYYRFNRPYPYDSRDEYEVCCYCNNVNLWHTTEISEYFDEKVNYKNKVSYRFDYHRKIKKPVWYMYEFITTDYNSVYPVNIYFGKNGDGENIYEDSQFDE